MPTKNSRAFPKAILAPWPIQLWEVSCSAASGFAGSVVGNWSRQAAMAAARKGHSSNYLNNLSFIIFVILLICIALNLYQYYHT